MRRQETTFSRTSAYPRPHSRWKRHACPQVLEASVAAPIHLYRVAKHGASSVNGASEGATRDIEVSQM